MWTAVWVTISASVMSLRSMRTLIDEKYLTHEEQNNPIYINYLIAKAEKLPEILIHLLPQLHKDKVQITLEIVFLGGQMEFLLHVPTSIYIPPELIDLLTPISPIWSIHYSSEYIIDDSESIYSTVLAHQLIIKGKAQNIAFVTVRGLKKTPQNYLTSGIDSFKWEKFVNKVADKNAEVITHDRIYSLIQEKVVSY